VCVTAATWKAAYVAACSDCATTIAPGATLSAQMEKRTAARSAAAPITGSVPHRPRMRGIRSIATISQATESPHRTPMARGL
jgi:hypothetical protein